MKKILSIFMVILCVPMIVNAELIGELATTFGGTGSDELVGVTAFGDGYAVVGNLYRGTYNDQTITNDDALIRVYDENNKLLWEKVYGGSGYENFNDVVSTPDGGLVAVGNFDSEVTGFGKVSEGTGIVVKYDKDGNVVWYDRYKTNHFNDVTTSTNHKIIVSGWDGVIVQYTLDGEVEGTAEVDNNYNYESLTVLNDGTIAAAGWYLGDDWDAGIALFTPTGKLKKIIIQTGSQYEYFYSIKATRDGGFVAVGKSDSDDMEGINLHVYEGAYTYECAHCGKAFEYKNKLDAEENYYNDLLKHLKEEHPEEYEKSLERLKEQLVSDLCEGPEELDSTGTYYYTCDDFEDKFKFDNTDITEEEIIKEIYNAYLEKRSDEMQERHEHHMIQENYHTPSLNFNSDGIIFKYDKNGNVEWSTSYGSEDTDEFIEVTELTNGDIIVAGTSSSKLLNVPNKTYYQDGMLIVFNKKGVVSEQTAFGGSDGHDQFESVEFLDNANFIAVGNSTSSVGGRKTGSIDFYITKIGRVYSTNKGEQSDNFEFEQREDVGVIKPEVEEGYVLDDIIVKDEFGEEVPLVKNENGEYEFPIVNNPVITVIYKKIYELTLNVGENGTATAEQHENGKGRIKAVPNEGYEIDEIIIKDTTGKEVVYEEKDGYYFFDVNDDLEITVTFKELPKEVVKGDEEEKEENPKTADAFIYYACAVVSSLFGIWSVEQYRKTVKE